MSVIYSLPAPIRRDVASNGLAYRGRWGISALRSDYRRLRRAGIGAVTARRILWDAAWFGSMHATFHPSSASPARRRVEAQEPAPAATPCPQGPATTLTARSSL